MISAIDSITVNDIITGMNSDASYDLDGLTAEVGRLLEELGLLDAQPDGRVTAAPDIRTIRYYAGLGLVDKPRYEGREARYGRRHVLQLAAIKALQAAELSLAEIQERLYARSAAELESILAAVRDEQRHRPVAPLRTVRWREVTVVPGLKVLAEDGWSPGTDPAALETKLRAAVAALAHSGGA